MNIFYNTLKSGGTKDHFRQVKVPGTTPYWKASDNILPKKLLQIYIRNKNFYST
jgi:hypothetical protein